MIQREIILNKANKRSATSTLPDATEPVQKSSKITVDSKFNAPPAQKTENNPPLKDATKTQPATPLPDVTNDLLLDATVDSNAVPNVINMTTPPATDDVKPSRGFFKTKRISIRRSKDPRTFKCSACDTHTSTLKELNAHFITNHQKVSCDICETSLHTCGGRLPVQVLKLRQDIPLQKSAQTASPHAQQQTVEKHSSTSNVHIAAMKTQISGT